jgi:hypothetical protein
MNKKKREVMYVILIFLPGHYGCSLIRQSPIIQFPIFRAI